jgi:hypothetical protein
VIDLDSAAWRDQEVVSVTVPASDEDAVRAALRLAIRAPSVHNCQPWRWRVGPGIVHLCVDGSRQVTATDSHGRDLLISCGAALHHLLVALASFGRGAQVRRMSNPRWPGHLATVEPFAQITRGREEALAAAILRRRTDRRRFSSWPVPVELLGEMIELARLEGVGLEVITDPVLRWKLFRAITIAAEQQATDPAYAAELAAWSGRGNEADDGVPAANAPAAQHIPGRMPLREYARSSLHQPPSTGEPENAALLLLTTPTDTARDWLRAGEVTSALLAHRDKGWTGEQPADPAAGSRRRPRVHPKPGRQGAQRTPADPVADRVGACRRGGAAGDAAQAARRRRRAAP